MWHGWGWIAFRAKLKLEEQLWVKFRRSVGMTEEVVRLGGTSYILLQRSLQWPYILILENDISVNSNSLTSASQHSQYYKVKDTVTSQ